MIIFFTAMIGPGLKNPFSGMDKEKETCDEGTKATDSMADVFNGQEYGGTSGWLLYI